MLSYKNKNVKQRGFTLIELLVVIAIIGLLSSVVLASLNSSRAKARDAKRISDIKQISLALEFFYDEHEYYPPTDKSSKLRHSLSYDTGCTWTPDCGHCNRWCILDEELPTIVIPNDMALVPSQIYYAYTSSNGDDFQTYGLAAFLETDHQAAKNDGGYYDNAFEVGLRPGYCMNKYTGNARDWLWRPGGGDWGSVCDGGN